MNDVIERPDSVLLLQATLLLQAAFDLFFGATVGAYYGWMMTLLQQVPGASASSAVLPLLGAGVPSLIGFSGAALAVVTTWGLSTRKPWVWLAGIATAAIHLFLNPCCSPLALVILFVFLREDVRSWIE